MANCPICGKKIGVFSKYGYIYDGEKSLDICEECEGFRKRLTDYMPQSRGEKSPAAISREYFEKYLDNESVSEILVPRLQKMINDSLEEENSQAESIKKKFEIEEINKNYHTLVNRCKYTTGYNFDGYRIKEYLDIVSGEIVLGTGFLSELNANINDLFGTQSNLFAQKMEEAKKGALEKLIKNAILSGGNAIIGVDFDYINFSNNMIGVSANGTVVTIEKIVE